MAWNVNVFERAWVDVVADELFSENHEMDKNEQISNTSLTNESTRYRQTRWQH
jgi:hypothetical protein